MTEYVQVLLIANLFRVLCLATGVMFGYFGYRLFVIGIYEKAGELKAAFGDKHLVLKQVGPGVFFALFGVMIAAVGGLRTLNVERDQPVRSSPIAETQSSQSSPDLSTSQLGPSPVLKGPSSRMKPAQGAGVNRVPESHVEPCRVTNSANSDQAVGSLVVECTPYPDAQRTKIVPK